MRRPKHDPVREDRIHNEAIVDACPEEQAMSWYYYLERRLVFRSERGVSRRTPSHRSEKGKPPVLRMAKEDFCEHDMLVKIRWQGRKMAVPLSQLEVIGAESTDEASATAITGSLGATVSDLRTCRKQST
jgi:hypothetical protein